MEKVVKYLFNYVVPILMALVLLIPFICVDGSGIDHIYLSPIRILIEKHINNFTNIIYILLTVAYVVFVFVKQDKNTFQIKRVFLIASTIVYFILFKLTSNTNLNLLSVVLNLIIFIIYLLNYIREYLVIKKEDEENAI